MTTRLVTVGDIASMAGVRSSAVSNWRRRHSDFPLPVEDSPSGALFDLESVVDWLRKNGKDFDLPERDVADILWQAIDKLRGTLDVEEGVLTLLQLLFIQHCAESQSDAVGGKTIDLWRIMIQTHNPVSHWRETVKRIAQQEPELARVLHPSQNLTERDTSRLIEIIEEEVVGDDRTDTSGLILRRLHEFLGRQGMNYTPDSIVDLLVELAKPIGGSAYDPACGSAMILGIVWRDRGDTPVTLYGQEVNEHSWRFGYLHLALNDANFKIENGDALRDDRFRDLRADRVFLDPPFGMRPSIDAARDERWEFGIPRRSADWFWAQHVIYHLAPEGMGLMLCSNSSLARGGIDGEIRRKIVRSGKVGAVIDLPPGSLPSTSMAPSLLILRHGEPSEDRVLFVDGRQLGSPRRGGTHEFTRADINKLSETVDRWKAGDFQDEPRFSAAVSIAEVDAKSGVLSPNRYIRYFSRVTHISGESISGRRGRLIAILQQHSQPMASLIDEIVDQATRFESIGQSDLPKLIRLGDLLSDELATGIRKAEGIGGYSIPYIATKMVTDAGGRIPALPQERIQINRQPHSFARYGDLLLVSRGIAPDRPIACAVVSFEGKAAFSESLMRLSVDERKADPHFVRMFLTSRQGRLALAAVTTGTIVTNLRKEAVLEIEIPLPSLREQQAIAAILLAIEDRVATLTSVMDLSTELFDTLREGVIGGLLTPYSKGINSSGR